MTGVAHAVCAELPLFGNAGDDPPPRTHAEREQVGLPAGNERVVGGTEQLEILSAAILMSVDVLLGLFDSQSHLERLGLQRQAAGQQSFVRVPGTVSNRQHHGLCREIPLVGPQAPHLTLLHVQIIDAAAKTILPSVGLDLTSQVPHQQGQSVAAQVGSMLVDNLGLAPAQDKLSQDPVHVGPCHPTGQLAIAESAGPALSKQVVVLGIEPTSRVELSDRGNSFLDRIPTLKNQRAISPQGKIPGGQESRRARSDHHGALGKWLLTRVGIEKSGRIEGLNLNSRREPRGSRNPPREFNLCAVDEFQIVSRASVQALSKDSPGPQVGRQNPQLPGDDPGQALLGLLNWQPDVCDTQWHSQQSTFQMDRLVEPLGRSVRRIKLPGYSSRRERSRAVNQGLVKPGIAPSGQE